MNFREATTNDISQLNIVRMSVKENVLRNPLLVSEADYINFLTENGNGWVCEIDDVIVGFAIIDTNQNNIWALFVSPGFEKMGIGKKLQEIMLNWFFNRSHNKLWLGTAPGTRAETFYKLTGWTEAGRRENGEVRFEMTYEAWRSGFTGFKD